VSPPLTAENGLTRLRFLACSDHCRRVQSLNCQYTICTPQCKILSLSLCTLHCTHTSIELLLLLFNLCMINWSILVYGQFGPQTHRPLTLTFTLNLTLSLLPNWTHYNHWLVFYILSCPRTEMSHDRSDCTPLNLLYLDVEINAFATHNPCYAKFSCRLGQTSQIWRLNPLSYM